MHGLSCDQTFTYKYWVEDVITEQSTSSNDGFFSFLPWVGPEITTSTTFVDNSGYTGSSDSFLVLNSNTGVFTWENYAAPTTVAKVQITVTTSDGYNTQTLTIDDIQISSSCGPQSTTVTLADTDLDERTNYLNIFPIPTPGNSFVSSNANCPISLSVSGESSLYDSAADTLL